MINFKWEDDSYLPFVTITQPSITTYKLVPDYTITNQNNTSIVNAFTHIYKLPSEMFNMKNLSQQRPNQIYFNILLKKNDVEFYLSTPMDHEDLIENKLKTIWNKSDIRKGIYSELNNLNIDNAEICELVLKDYNFKSLNTDTKNLYPLTNMLGITKALKDNEKVRVCIIIEPIKRTDWINIAKDEYKAYKLGKTINKEMSIKEKIAKLGFLSVESALNLYIDFKIMILESIFGAIMPGEDEKDKLDINLKIDGLERIKEENKAIGLTTMTTRKQTSEAFKVKIVILSESIDINRRKLNMLSIANSYKDLNSDNELVIRLYNKKDQQNLFKRVLENKLFTSKDCIMSDSEVAKLIQLPQKDLQNEYNIQRIDTREVDVPTQLQNGLVRIGEAEKQGKKVMTTWSMDKNIMALGKVFLGGQNCGKTTAIKRTVKDCYKAGYSNIVIDYIEDCDTAKEIARVIPDKDKIFITLGTKDNIPSLAYTEVSSLITEDMDVWDRVRYANLIAEQVEYFINAVTDEGTGELTAPMMRYLHAASMVTFIKPGTTIGDVFDVLRRWDKRNEAIRDAKYSKCFDEDDDIFFDLNELHERDPKGKIIGTREHLIIGITNRIVAIQKNPYLKAMLKSNGDNNNFTQLIEEGKSIFILIPQNYFPNQATRDMLTTFFISRIWLTVQLRKNNKDARLCNVIFDEVHQVQTTAKFLSNHVTEFRRHRLGLILSCHYLGQLGKLELALKSSGASYILMAGAEKKNFENLKEELSPFTIEDFLSLKEHCSLNLINYGNQYAKYITLLPEF